jgi:ABC-type nitrate/sulfonate/bicarbonate transport system permease component
VNSTTLRKWGANVGLAILAIAFLFGVWNAVIAIGGLKPYILPTPQSAVSQVVHNWHTLRPLTWQTIKETVAGFFIGAIVGFVLAILMSTFRPVQKLIYPALITSQAVPVVAVAAPIVIIFGFGMLPKLIIVTWIVFFPVAVNVLDGLAHIDADLINLSHVLGASRTREFMHIRLPATLTPLFSGLKIGATYAVSGAVIGEWTASANQGLGTYLLSANSSLNAPAVFGATMVLTVIGVLSFLLVGGAEGLATPWRKRSTARRRFKYAPARSVSTGERPADFPHAALSNPSQARSRQHVSTSIERGKIPWQ